MALLNDRFKLLWQGRRTALPRHQTLSAALDWSYDLLSEVERRVLNRLSVFAGLFALEAARSVVAKDDVDDTRAVTVIASLIAKSLIAINVRDGTRYRLLDTTRAYAADKLAESGEADAIRRRHAVYYCELFRRTKAEPTPPDPAPKALRRGQSTSAMFAPPWSGVSPRMATLKWASRWRLPRRRSFWKCRC